MTLSWVKLSLLLMFLLWHVLVESELFIFNRKLGLQRSSNHSKHFNRNFLHNMITEVSLINTNIDCNANFPTAICISLDLLAWCMFPSILQSRI